MRDYVKQKQITSVEVLQNNQHQMTQAVDCRHMNKPFLG